MVVQLHQVTGYEAPRTGIARRGLPLKCEECLDIGDRWTMLAYSRQESNQ